MSKTEHTVGREQSVSFTHKELQTAMTILLAELAELEGVDLSDADGCEEDLLKHKMLVVVVGQKLLTASRTLEKAHGNQTT